MLCSETVVRLNTLCRTERWDPVQGKTTEDERSRDVIGAERTDKGLHRYNRHSPTFSPSFLIPKIYTNLPIIGNQGLQLTASSLRVVEAK